MDKNTLLLIDDEEMLLRSLQRVLEDDGYEILTATSAQDALKILSNTVVQVIISDQRMPNMTGSELFAQVKKEYPETIRIILSGYADFDAVKSAINDGDIYKFLNKPWDNNFLRKMVKEAFDIYKHQTKSPETIKKETEAEVKRLQEQFLANISHEIRTPLNGILGFAEILNKGVIDPLSPEHKEYLGDILVSSQTLSKLLINALDLLQADSHTMEFHPEKVDLDKLIAEVKDAYTSMAGKKGISITTKVDTLPIPVKIDSEKLKEVLTQLVSNAVKFTNSGGNVEIVARSESDSKFRIDVKDNGIGISDQDKERLFKPFQQLDMRAGKKFQGAGLGLALAKRIVELQGGQIGVKSQIGKGSVFFVVLPSQS